MNKRPVETIMGIVVIAVAIFFAYFAYNVSDLQVVQGYNVTSKFLKVGGLTVGSDVRLNGIKVGTVVAQKLNPDDYTAEVKMSLSSDIQLPEDSTFSIVSDGLMGDPGHGKTMLQDGSVVKNTKDFKTLEDMVGEIIFMVTDDGSAQNS